MFITRVLMFYVRQKRIPGRIDIGKVQFVPRITPAMKKKALEQLMLERDNLKVISNPWLTQAEEAGHMRAKLRKKWYEENEQRKVDRMFKHRHMEDELDHLKISKRWE